MPDILASNSMPVPLPEARERYVAGLERFRFQLHPTHGPSDEYHQVAESTRVYKDAFRAHLLGACGVDGALGTSLGPLTVDEIELRREQIAERFDTDPIRLYPESEFLVALSAVTGIATSAAAGRIPGVIGGGVLLGTTYFSYTYRRKCSVVDSSIEDTDLLDHAIDELDNSDDASPDHCMRVFDASVDSEHSSVLRMSTQLLRARTYTPFGFMRLAAYNFRAKRRAKKRAANE